jgi:formylglycine-generating enzyme required for sulfatase activity
LEDALRSATLSSDYPKPEQLLDSEEPVTLLIPAGPFWMGSPPDDPRSQENELPGREVVLPEYRIGRYPVTNAQYARFIADEKAHPPDHWPDGRVPAGLQDHPVVHVSHSDAASYCRWLSRRTGKQYRLPTEDEWEKAARGGRPEMRRYPWGDEWLPGRCNTRELGRGSTSSVYEFSPAGQSLYGVVDMAGNVWEWTASWYMPYPGSTHTSKNYGQHRVVRGGSWENAHDRARISFRGRYEPTTKRPYLGFRVAMEEK